MTKILGRAKILIDGTFYDSEPGAECQIGGITHTSRMFTHGHKYSERKIPGRVSCSLPLTPDLSIKKLQALAGVVVHFECDSGQTYVFNNMAQTGDVVFSDGDQGGTVPLEFYGDPAEELT